MLTILLDSRRLPRPDPAFAKGARVRQEGIRRSPGAEWELMIP